MPTVLVTGAGRGIGRAIAERLAEGGFDVLAGVRTEQDAAAVRAARPHRVTPVILDVTDPRQLAALPDALPERLDAVVNNAGIVVAGPLEALTDDDLRRQFDVNVVGQLAVTRAVLPRLRAARGRVVFVSSLNGRLSMPLMGAYSASKFALEAAADALRMELRPWDVEVVVVEPAQTDTDLWRTADAMVHQAESQMTNEHRRLYADHVAGIKKMIPMSQRMAVPADKVAAVVSEALIARRPRPRYIVGVAPRVQLAVLTALPTRLRDRVLRAVSGMP